MKAGYVRPIQQSFRNSMYPARQSYLVYTRQPGQLPKRICVIKVHCHNQPVFSREQLRPASQNIDTFPTGIVYLLFSPFCVLARILAQHLCLVSFVVSFLVLRLRFSFRFSFIVCILKSVGQALAHRLKIARYVLTKHLEVLVGQAPPYILCDFVGWALAHRLKIARYVLAKHLELLVGQAPPYVFCGFAGWALAHRP